MLLILMRYRWLKKEQHCIMATKAHFFLKHLTPGEPIQMETMALTEKELQQVSLPILTYAGIGKAV